MLTNADTEQMGEDQSAELDPTEQAFILIDKDVLLKALRDLPSDKCRNGKTFFKSYVKWPVLTPEQKLKTKLFWRESIDDNTRKTIIEEYEKATMLSVSEDSARQALTNKHDRARLLHLRVDPTMSATWTQALRDKTRQELDDKSGCATEDPYAKLADKFNDPNTKYANVSVIQGKLDMNGCICPTPKMELIAARCFDIDPSAPNRPLRDGGWIRTKFKELKSKLSVAYNNFTRSGKQDAENPYDEWIPFAEDDVIVYAKAIMTKSDFEYLGKALRGEAQMDTGVLDEADSLERRAERAAARRKQRAEKRTRDDARLDDISELSSPGSAKVKSLADAMDMRLKEFVEIEQKKLANDAIRLEHESKRAKQEADNAFLVTALGSGDNECREAARKILLARLADV